MNYACDFSQSETEKYFEWMLIVIANSLWVPLTPADVTPLSRRSAILVFFAHLQKVLFLELDQS